MNRYVCIHGHFYQPPRENPWLEIIEEQKSACPYHDWNERIADECYGPNAASRIMNTENRIIRMVNNYSRMSFDFGPTLLSWLEKKAPDIYKGILSGDQESRKRFSGHGGALAQAYNHMIMPLANARDKTTQVIWGIKDFEYRFHRKPEGMWLPETAVDLETLDIMAAAGIRFTILAPRQAGRVRTMSGSKWEDVGTGQIDATMPYLQRLPSGKSMALFFYDAAIAHAIAFEGLLSSGASLLKRLLAGFTAERDGAQLVHVATDGESYGHHHRFGDMALTHVLDNLSASHGAALTTYGEFLQRHPPTHEVEILENTAWSCSHGVERWRSNCGCHTGEHPEWNQSWRPPLRQALDHLRDRLACAYEEEMRRFAVDPWEIRNQYIGDVLDRSADAARHFLRAAAKRPLAAAEGVKMLQLLELQRHAMLMYTSCGWFFDDIAGIEVIQDLRHAGYALDLAGALFKEDFRSGFLKMLSRAESNQPHEGDGRRIFEKHVTSAQFSPERVCAHAAIRSLFQADDERNDLGCWSVYREKHGVVPLKNARLVMGRNRVVDGRIGSCDIYNFAVLDSGRGQIRCGIHKNQKETEYDGFAQKLTDIFNADSMGERQTFFDAFFDQEIYTWNALLREERKALLKTALREPIDQAEAAYRRIYAQTASKTPLVMKSGAPVRKLILQTREWVINTDLQRAFADEALDTDKIRALLKEAAAGDVKLDALPLAHLIKRRLEQAAERLATAPRDPGLIQNLLQAAALIGDLPFPLDLWKVQQHCGQIAASTYKPVWELAEARDPQARDWISHFRSIADRLSICINPDLTTESR